MLPDNYWCLVWCWARCAASQASGIAPGNAAWPHVDPPFPVDPLTCKGNRGNHPRFKKKWDPTIRASGIHVVWFPFKTKLTRAHSKQDTISTQLLNKIWRTKYNTSLKWAKQVESASRAKNETSKPRIIDCSVSTAKRGMWDFFLLVLSRE